MGPDTRHAVFGELCDFIECQPVPFLDQQRIVDQHLDLYVGTIVLAQRFLQIIDQLAALQGGVILTSHIHPDLPFIKSGTRLADTGKGAGEILVILQRLK